MPAQHFNITVAHLPSSCSFYLSALQSLGYRDIGQYHNRVGLGVDEVDFFICQETSEFNRSAVRIEFIADSRASVDHFHQAAIKAGGQAADELRVIQPGCSYSRSVYDLDGNIAECVYREPVTVTAHTGACDPSCVSATRTGQTSRSAPALEALVDSNRCDNHHQKQLFPVTTTFSVTQNSSTRNSKEESGISPVHEDNHDKTIEAVSDIETSTSSGFFDNSKALIGTLLGVATGAAVAYALLKPDNSRTTPQAQEIAHERAYRDQAVSAIDDSPFNQKEVQTHQLQIEEPSKSRDKTTDQKDLKYFAVEGPPIDQEEGYPERQPVSKTALLSSKKLPEPGHLVTGEDLRSSNKKTGRVRRAIEGRSTEEDHLKQLSRPSKLLKVHKKHTRDEKESRRQRRAIELLPTVLVEPEQTKLGEPPCEDKVEEPAARVPEPFPASIQVTTPDDNMSTYSRTTAVRMIEPYSSNDQARSHVSAGRRSLAPSRSVTYPSARSGHSVMEPARSHVSHRSSSSSRYSTPHALAQASFSPHSLPFPTPKPGSKITVTVTSPPETVRSSRPSRRGAPPSAFTKYTTETYEFSPRSKGPEEYSLPPSSRSSEVSRRSSRSRRGDESISRRFEEMSFVSRAPSKSRSVASASTIKPASRFRVERAMTDIDDSCSIAPSDSISCVSEKPRRSRRSSRSRHG